MIPLSALIPASNTVVGSNGEAIATHFLRSIGYVVLDRNVRLGRDEIDIIAWDQEDNVIVFVEVKARTCTSQEFHPLLNLTARKQAAMSRAARLWVAGHEWDGGYRLDVLCVSNGEVDQHIREYPWASES